MSVKKISRNHYLKLSVALFGLLGAGHLYGADLLSSATGDATAVGKVSSAELMPAGQMAVGMSIDGADRINYRSSSKQLDILSSGHLGALNFSLGLHEFIQLDFAVRGSYEALQYPLRSGLYNGQDEEGLKVRETAYAGSRMQVKIGLYQSPNFSLAFAPFIEEGMGQHAKYALTRSEKLQGGFLGMMTYGQRGIAEFSLNLGMKYRNPVDFGDRLIRNEGILKSNLKVFVSEEISVFLSGNARKLMIAEKTENEDLKYVGKDSGEVLLGASFENRDFIFSIYGGGEVIKNADYGMGKNSYGLNVAYKFGNTNSDKRWATKKKDVNAGDWQPKGKKKKSSIEDQYPEMSGDINALSDMPDDKDDDFDRLKKRMKNKRKVGLSKSGVSVDEEVERELAELKAAEEKVTAEKLKMERSEENLQEKARKFKAEKNRYKKIENRAGKVIDDKYSINASDVSWQGLDD